jgi:hypothetical protein
VSEVGPYSRPPAPDWPWVIPATVYVFYDADSVPLYVGCTTRQYVRFDGHGHKPWWTDVARIEVEHFADRSDGQRREKHLIRALRPLHNQEFHPDHVERLRQKRAPQKAAA